MSQVRKTLTDFYVKIPKRSFKRYIDLNGVCNMNYQTEYAFTAFRNGMESIMHPPHEPIMYSRNNIFKLNENPHQYFFKTGSADINKTR